VSKAKTKKVPPSRLGRATAKAVPALPATAGPKRLRPLAHHATSDDWQSRKPAWSFALVDHDFDGSWSWTGVGAKLPGVLVFLRDMETLTWKEIRHQMYFPKTKTGHTRNHAIPLDRLGREAQDRLEELGLGDLDELFVFRVDFSGRLWGVNIPDSNVFALLWWDADHQVYPLGK
jgi:hypothetical protein